MAQATILETVIIVVGVALFIGALIGVMLMLTVLRRRRTHTAPSVNAVPIPTSAPAPQAPIVLSAPVVPAAPPPVEHEEDTDPVPDWMRMPLRDVSPDQVVIMIEPEPGPTPQRRNIQRLIDHLQTDAPANVG